jgi:hypothetical protein
VSKIIRTLTSCLVLVLVLSPAWGLAGSTGVDGSNAQAVHALGETGDGVNVGLISQDNTRVTHEAFFDKDVNGNPIGSTHAFSYDATGDGLSISDHDTWVAGIVASRGGIAHPNEIGVAPGVDIYSAKIVSGSGQISTTYLTNALDYLVNQNNCRVIVTGIQLYHETLLIPNGDSDWTKIYDYYAYSDEYNVVFANAAGNYVYTGDPPVLVTDRITIFGDAYNGITTAGLKVTAPDVYNTIGTGSKSSEGLTQDGRDKPDLAAPSQNQTVPHVSSTTSWYDLAANDGATSFSAPHTAGVAALLLGLADESGNPDAAENEVIKAAIINSTFPNINDKSNNITTGQTFHYQRGYGRIDALRAYQLLNSPQLPADSGTTEPKGWAFEEIQKDQTHIYSIYVEKNHRLIVTITWNRYIRKIGNNYTAEDPILNLNLAVNDPDAISVFSENDAENNLEKVDIIAQKTGYYEITVTNVDNSTERNNTYYGLAFEISPPIAGDFDLNYIVEANDLYHLSEQWLTTGPSGEFDLFKDDSNSVNMNDFSVFSDYWMCIDSAYHN